MRTYVRLGLLLAAVLALAVLADGGTPAYAWSAPAPLNTNAASDIGDEHWARVATDGAGNWVAVWNSDEDLFDPNLGGTIGTDDDILVSRSTNNGPPGPLPSPSTPTPPPTRGMTGSLK